MSKLQELQNQLQALTDKQNSFVNTTFNTYDKEKKEIENQKDVIRANIRAEQQNKTNVDNQEKKDLKDLQLSQIQGAEQLAQDQKQQEAIQEQRVSDIEQERQTGLNQQNDFVAQLQKQAAGNANTAAQQALTASKARQQAQQRAVAASQTGATSAGLRGAARAGAQTQRDFASQQEALNVQEQLAARQQLAQQLSNQQQQNIQQQQFQGSQALQGVQNQFGMQQAQQIAGAQEEQLATELRLAKEGAKLQTDLAKAANPNPGIGGLLRAGATIAGAKYGGPAGATAANAGFDALSYAKGGKVPKQNMLKSDKTPKMPKSNKNLKMPKSDKASKMSKQEMFGYKKAMQSNTKSANYAQGGFAEPIVKDDETGKRIDNMSDAFSIKDAKDIEDRFGRKKEVARAKETEAVNAATETRANQAQLLAQLQTQGTPLANVQLKQKSEQSLANQLAAANSGKQPQSQEQLQAALQATQANQAGQLVNQASQIAAQEQSALQSVLGGTLSGVTGSDLQRSQTAQQLATQNLGQESAIRQAQRQALLNMRSLRVDEEAANNAAQAARAAMPKQKKFLGLFNAGGKIPGKEKVAGDSVKNDTIPAMLSPGEIVIPKTVVQKGEKAMHGFIKGIQDMEKKKYAHGGKVKKMSKGGKMFTDEDREYYKNAEKKIDRSGMEEHNKKLKKDKEDKKKDAAMKSQLGQAALKEGVKLLSAPAKRKRAIADAKAKNARSEFATGLSKVRSRRNYAKGGKVSAKSYGEVLQARKQLDEKKKKIEDKKKRK